MREETAINCEAKGAGDKQKVAQFKLRCLSAFISYYEASLEEIDAHKCSDGGLDHEDDQKELERRVEEFIDYEQ